MRSWVRVPPSAPEKALEILEFQGLFICSSSERRYTQHPQIPTKRTKMQAKVQGSGSSIGFLMGLIFGVYLGFGVGLVCPKNLLPLAAGTIGDFLMGKIKKAASGATIPPNEMIVLMGRPPFFLCTRYVVGSMYLMVPNGSARITHAPCSVNLLSLSLRGCPQGLLGGQFGRKNESDFQMLSPYGILQ